MHLLLLVFEERLLVNVSIYFSDHTESRPITS